MQVRVATPEDLDGVIEVGTTTWWATYPPLAGDDYVRAGIARWWTREAVRPGIEAGRVLVAEQQGRLIAMASYSLLEEAAMLWKLYVLPEAQGAGAGRALLDAVLEAAEGRPIRLTHVVGNDRARAVYERFGFRETGRKPSPIPGGPEEVSLERPATPRP